MPMSEYMSEVRRKVGRQLLEVPAVSIVVQNHDGHVLLVRHSETGSWMTPGGAIVILRHPGKLKHEHEPTLLELANGIARRRAPAHSSGSLQAMPRGGHFRNYRGRPASGSPPRPRMASS